MRNSKILIIILVTWSISPLIWQLYTSLATFEALTNPFDVHSNRWTLENYSLIMNSDPPFWRYILNSTFLAFLTTLITLLFSIPAAYSLVNINKNLSKYLRLSLLSIALFPYVLLFIALLDFARILNVGNNLFALSIPYAALTMPLAILLLYTAFRDLPTDLEAASKLEGLNLFQRIKWIYIPIISPSIGSTAILIFLFAWNEYPIALTWISKTNLLTLPVAIARIAGSSVYSVPYGAYAAATVIGSIPLLMIVFIFQKRIISGLTQGAVKG